MSGQRRVYSRPPQIRLIGFAVRTRIFFFFTAKRSFIYAKAGGYSIAGGAVVFRRVRGRWPIKFASAEVLYSV